MYWYVLIETYWNVNSIKERSQSIKKGVLIETYWNVNSQRRIPKRHPICRLNRNILECKCKWYDDFVGVCWS